MHRNMYFGERGPKGVATGLLHILLFLCLACAPAVAEDDTAGGTHGAEAGLQRSLSTGAAFFDDARVSGGLYFFLRDRRRYNPETRRYAANLNHATLQAGAEFTSGFAGGFLGFDAGVFASSDLYNHGATDHEMSFVPWDDPWHPDWSKSKTRDGVSVYRAHLKARAGKAWARVGHFQPSGPGVLGVNWSLFPGTYRGGEAGVDLGPLSLAAAWADAYKAPWYRYMNRFKKDDGETGVGALWSLGARYQTPFGLRLEAAYGESRRYLTNAHVKFDLEMAPETAAAGIFAGYHLYLMRDADTRGVNDNFAGVASQHYLYARYKRDPWTFRLEGTWTRAPFVNEHQQGYFAYRLTAPNGSSKGAYEPWWDARSDWNAHNEKAVFAGVSRSLDDLGLRGVSLGAGAAFGWDGQGYATAERLKEWAFTCDVGYTRQEGLLQGAWIKVHYTEYRNGSAQSDWSGYKNAFQDERDLKVMAGIPFSL